MDQQPQPSSEQVPKDDTSPDDSLSNSIQASCCICPTCSWAPWPWSESTPMSTTEEITQSSTEPTDESISLSEDVVLDNLNPAQQPQVGHVRDKGTLRLVKKCLKCQQKTSQDSTESNDDPTDPTDVSSSSAKEGIEMDNIRQGNEASAVQTDRAKSGDSKKAGTAGLQEQESTDTDASSQDLPLETRV